LSETFLILRRIERDIIKNVYGSLYKIPAISVILIKLELLDRFFEKFSNIKLPENPPCGIQDVP
jgi:hypothetical protein